jgi:hypothetical protein
MAIKRDMSTLPGIQRRIHTQDTTSFLDAARSGGTRDPLLEDRRHLRRSCKYDP